MIRRMFGSTVKNDSGLNILDYNPNVWLDAQDVSTITLVDGKMSQWANKANSNHVIQTNATMRPLYGVDVVSNGFPSVKISEGNGIGFVLSYAISIHEIIMVTSYKNGVESISTNYHTVISGPGTAGSPNRIVINELSSSFFNSTMCDSVFKNHESETNILLPLPLTVCNFRLDNKSPNILWSIFKNSDPSFAVRNFPSFTGEIILFENQLAMQDRTEIINHLMKKWKIS